MTLRLRMHLVADGWRGLHAGEAAGLPAPPPWAGQWSGLDWRLPTPGGSFRTGDRGGWPGWVSFTCGPRPRRLWGLWGGFSFFWVLYLLRAQWLWLLQREHRGVQALPEAVGETNAPVQCQAATSGWIVRAAGTTWQLPQEPPWAAGGHPWGSDHAAAVSAPAAHNGGGRCARHGSPTSWTFQVTAGKTIASCPTGKKTQFCYNTSCFDYFTA